MSEIAFLTMEDPGEFWVYDHLVHEPLRNRGITTHDVPWNRADVDWNAYAMVVIRWPWDYWHHKDEFISVLEAIDASSAKLQNSLATVRWNINKSYLKDLQSRGVQIVPTHWLSSPDSQGLQQVFEHFDCRRAVVKPVVGAGAEGAFRISTDDSAEQLQRVADASAGTDLLAQPFVDSVVETGEYSLIYFNNDYSHAILKTPARGDYRVQEEYGGAISAVTPEDDLIQFGQRALTALDEVPLYSRVDVVRLADGSPALMELELIEPSLYFPYDEQSADRMAAAVQQRLPASH